MPKFLIRRWHGMHVLWALGLIFLLTVALAWYEWLLGLVGLVFGGVVCVYFILAERAFRRDLQDYVLTLTRRIRNVGADVVAHLPFGIILYNEDREVEWHNPFVAEATGRASVVGVPLEELFPELRNPSPRDEAQPGKTVTRLGDRVFELIFRQQERLVYVIDMTEQWSLAKRYEDEKIALGIVMMDNFEEVAQGMDEQQRTLVLSRVTGRMSEWAQEHGMLLRRMSADRYLIVTNKQTLRRLEQSRFDLLDEVREMTADLKLPLTLSIGFAAGFNSILEIGQQAQSSLDIALGRGGDQAVVRVGQRQSFYGGKSSAVEKRTRVRARVIAHALRDLIRDSDNVIVMGHAEPDMDAIGASVGVWKMARHLGKESFIVLEDVNPSIERIMNLLREDDQLYAGFVKPEQALMRATRRTLAVVVDTHRASMVPEPRLFEQTERVVIIDHHRRSEEIIQDAVLVYMEPYASSTCELVTELLQYVDEDIELEPREATALLAGITVDTKSFSVRTGARTFEAASYLRRSGADGAAVQRMMQEKLEEYVRKAEIVRHAEIWGEDIAIAAVERGEPVPQLLIAQAADMLMNMSGIAASFVIAKRPDGLVGISARSQGKINVQVVMEKLGGGGHLNDAAAQLKGSVREAAARLKAVLQELTEGEGQAE
ncbi:MAG: hypothetical protein BAA02_13380 [Paenibacillaceae bacterium ZCTH02-B3]|nr:MAG: hypothetical protein BAA02_13380 [Paenibacillaceae bacterium ZCTH02-B3]